MRMLLFGKIIADKVDKVELSYLVNDKGNKMRFTLGGQYIPVEGGSYSYHEGYGSSTPADKIDEWIATLSDEENNRFADLCDTMGK